MSGSVTRTQSNTVSWTDVRYVNDKIGADLRYIRGRYPTLYSEEDVEEWKNDFYQWIHTGYASSVRLEFYTGDTVIGDITWEVRRDGTITGDDLTGRMGLPDLSGCTGRVRVFTNSSWKELSDEEREQFYADLNGNWGPGKPPKYTSGLVSTLDKEYSKNQLGVQRTVRRSGI